MPLSRKNYLKKNDQVFEYCNVKEKDEELFDKLLSSPLKQEVSFQPLSFWKNKVRPYNPKKNTKKNSCWLYESSESDDSCKSPSECDSEPNWSFSESESSDNQTVLENPCQSQANNTDLQIDNSASPGKYVKLVTDKINEMKLTSATNATYVISESEIAETPEEKLTNINLLEKSLFLDGRLVTKRRKYNFSNLNVSPKTSHSNIDQEGWVTLKPLARESQMSDESFTSDKIFASTSQCHNEEPISSLIESRHIAIRKRPESSRRFSEVETQRQDGFECSRMSTLSSLDLSEVPSASSTDSEFQAHANRSEDSIFYDSQISLDTTVALKPGKKWKRSMSILKHYGNNSIGEIIFQNSKIKGSKYKDFVESVLEMQDVSSKMLCDGSVSSTSMKYRSSDESFTIESGMKDEDEFLNNTELMKSFFNDTVSEKTFLNRTVKITQPDNAPSAFRSALGLEQPESFVEDVSTGEVTPTVNSSLVSARDFVLSLCNQEDIVPFEKHFNEETLKDCRKIGEGVYGEVFLCSETVIKIIPIEGTELVNDEKQKTFKEIISEVVIASKLSNLRNGDKYKTNVFSEMKKCWCVKGKYPPYLIQLWEEYNNKGLSENDSPEMFKDDQLYIILELSNGGQDLESFVFKSCRQSQSVFIQIAFGLAVAEKAFEFEHRDLHWGNILVSKIDEEFVNVVLDGEEYNIPSRGVKACIIDFTLSRISHEGCSVFNNLSADPTLFTGVGDYQFEIYRMMLNEVMNDWSLFRPRNNVFWLHYMIDKVINMVHYKNKKTDLKYRKNLVFLKSIILNFNSSVELVTSDVIKNLLK